MKTLAMNTFKNSSGFQDFTQQVSQKNSQTESEEKEFLSAAVKITVNLDFWYSYKSKNNGENYYLDRHSETLAKLVMKLFEATS